MPNELIPIEHKNQRVLSTQQVADGYGTETDNISKNYTRNLERYIAGVHYYIVEGDELRQFKASGQIDGLPSNANRIFLWTEKGCFLHAKSLNTDKAWDVYSELIDTYFHKQQAIDYSKLSPELQMVQALLLSSAKLETEVKQLQTTTQAIKDTIITQPDNWREEINRMMNRIAQAIGIGKYQDASTKTQGETATPRLSRGHM